MSASAKHKHFPSNSDGKGLWYFACIMCLSFVLGACGNGSGGGDSTTSLLPAVSHPLSYPLRIDPTSRYLVDQNGNPFLLVGDAAWSLFAALSDSDADLYLENRRQLGFTAVLANLIEHQFAAKAPKNFYGVPPFTGQSFTTPNEDYFAHVDYIVQSAAAKGIVLLLSPLYLGFDCGSQGWCAEVRGATAPQMKAWGQYIGNRYKHFDNIIWVIGGDTDPRPVRTQVQAMVDGIISADSRHLFTAHNARGQMAVTPWSGAAWININNVYVSGADAYKATLAAHSIVPPAPVFLIEGTYENEHGETGQKLRAQSYSAILGGGFGHVFGNCPIWGFGFTTGFCASTKWKAELNGVGAMNMRHFQALFHSRHWHSLIPDTAHTVLTGEDGTVAPSGSAMAAYAADGSSVIVYMPSSRTITVNGSSLAGTTMIAWWYNPGDGVATKIGTYSTTESQTFSPPASGDWVLVLDSSDYAFAPPGSN